LAKSLSSQDKNQVLQKSIESIYSELEMESLSRTGLITGFLEEFVRAKDAKLVARHRLAQKWIEVFKDLYPETFKNSFPLYDIWIAIENNDPAKTLSTYRKTKLTLKNQAHIQQSVLVIYRALRQSMDPHYLLEKFQTDVIPELHTMLLVYADPQYHFHVTNVFLDIMSQAFLRDIYRNQYVESEKILIQIKEMAASDVRFQNQVNSLEGLLGIMRVVDFQDESQFLVLWERSKETLYKYHLEDLAMIVLKCYSLQFREPLKLILKELPEEKTLEFLDILSEFLPSNFDKMAFVLGTRTYLPLDFAQKMEMYWRVKVPKPSLLQRYLPERLIGYFRF
jgi:hypothetical protein